MAKLELKASMYLHPTLNVGGDSIDSIVDELKKNTAFGRYQMLKGAQIVLYLEQFLNDVQLQSAIQKIESVGLVVVALSGIVEKNVADKVGLPIFKRKRNDGVSVLDVINSAFMSNVKVHKSSIKSGEVVEAVDGDLIVVGNISHGGKAISGGDIFVMGELRGIALAGKGGDAQATIMATKLNPQYVEISGVKEYGYSLSGDERENLTLTLKFGRIVISD